MAGRKRACMTKRVKNRMSDIAFSRKMFGLLTILTVVSWAVNVICVNAYPERDWHCFIALLAILLFISIYAVPRLTHHKVVWPDYSWGIKILVYVLLGILAFTLAIFMIDGWFAPQNALFEWVVRVEDGVSALLIPGYVISFVILGSCYLQLRKSKE